MSTVAVVGAGGFVGAHLCRALELAGHTVIAAVRKSTNLSRLQALTTAPILRLGSLHHPSPWFIDKPDVIYNAAAYGAVRGQRDLSKLIEVNITGAAALLTEAQNTGVKRFIQLGTAYEHGHSERALVGTDPLRPQGLYGASKAASSLMLTELGETVGLRPCIVRLFNLFGPTMTKQNIISEILHAAHTGEPLQTTEGVEIRDFSDVQDVARWLALLASTPSSPAGEHFTLSAGYHRSMADLFGQLKALTGAPLQVGARPSRGNFPAKVVANSSPFFEFVDAPKTPTPLNQSIAQLVKS